MKKRTFIPYLLLFILLLGSCKKAAESAVDCFGESLLTSVHVMVSSTNAKQVTTEVRYGGTKTISGIKWEFGDGSTASTTERTSTHVYATPGSYTVTARVTFSNGTSSCEVDPTRTVNIQ